ncbi:uncharacterized protein BT62DRAFT_936662 [Guyanagaster necrorhizus]|uniref:Uncharacterized protein n=1 Tax=Guyanagaster necrorhizus TaxID=856835 RepID=A0A9P7VJY2_9AGAR|nr:uncharacterized protein BT62DRAFT_936662 [Guyanagaster necrorhizus MCA 3950]KAG7442007.1 hypothetical protein BT62DRAFT_936662 [Guyanagaster necrorhizus MCA 3950]
MSELQIPLDTSNLFDFPENFPSYDVHHDQPIDHHLFSSVGDFNVNAPALNDPDVTFTLANQMTSHSYIYDNPQAPPFLPKHGTSATNYDSYLPLTGHPATQSYETYLPPQPVLVSTPKSLSDPIDFGDFDYKGWLAEQGIIGWSTFTRNGDIGPNRICHFNPSGRLIGSPKHRAIHRYHPYARPQCKKRPGESSLFRTGFKTTYLASP